MKDPAARLSSGFVTGSLTSQPVALNKAAPKGLLQARGSPAAGWGRLRANPSEHICDPLYSQFSSAVGSGSMCMGQSKTRIQPLTSVGLHSA